MTLSLRPYRPSDRTAVRRICLETAFRYRGIEEFFEDRELFADYWTNYYLRFEADLCFVLENEETEVVGYLLGCPNSSLMFRRMKTRILPGITARMILRLLTFRYKKSQTIRYIRWMLFNSWREIPPIPLARFPAHYHLNVLKKAAFQGGFSRLLLHYLDRLEELGVSGIYGVVLEPESGGFFTRLAKRIKPLSGVEQDYFWEGPSSLYKIVLKDKTPMVNRVYASTVSAYKTFIMYIAQRFGY
jgi:hypothetical protein